MALTDRIFNNLNIKISERKNFGLLFIQTLLFGFANSFFLVITSAYFIKKASVSSLPSGYIISGIFGFLLTAFYKKILKTSGAVKAYGAVFLSYGILALVLFLLRLNYNDSSPVSLYVAYLGFMGISPFAAVLLLGFSKIMLKIYNISESKRLLALVGTGEVFASFIAFLLVPVLTKIMGGSIPLLLWSSVFSFLSIISLQFIAVLNKEKLKDLDEEKKVTKFSFDFFKGNNFYILFALVTILSVLAVYFVDFSFLISVRYWASEGKFETASVFAIIFCIIRFGELVFSLLSRTLMSNYGMKVALLVQPIILLGATIFATFFGLFSNSTFYIIAFLIFNKLAIRVFSRSLTNPAMKVLYLVTSPAHRAQLQTSIDGTLSQYAAFASGVLLLIISSCFGKTPVITFLIIVSMICLVAFSAWVYFTNGLFNNYKIKIKEYLHLLLKTDKNENEVFDHVKLKLDPQISMTTPLMKKALSLIELTTKEKIVNYIACYNPSIANISPDDSIFISSINRTYYNNENFFSRVLIVWLQKFLDVNTRLEFIKEYYNISELPLKIQMMEVLNSEEFVAKPEDRFFFENLIKQTVYDIFWTESAIIDISGKTNPLLVELLQKNSRILQTLLFELLKVLYEPESINAVQEIITSEDHTFEDTVFAVELLDNILESSLKKLIVPLFEDIPYNAKKEKLQKLILVYNETVANRLKEILLTNFMNFGPHIKKIALEEYYKLTKDGSLLNAFASSHVDILHTTANILLQKSEDEMAKNKENVAEILNLEKYFSPMLYNNFISWGIFNKDKKKQSSVFKNVSKRNYQGNNEYIEPVQLETARFFVDVFGLSLLMKLEKWQKIELHGE